MSERKQETWETGPRRGAVAPTIEGFGERGETLERHPAYAQIRASRVEGTTYLYGSDFVHRRYITVTIARSSLTRGLSNDWPHAESPDLIEVALSEAQWAAFVSSMNVGMGVQCTMTWYRPEGMIPAITRVVDRVKQFKAEFGEAYQNVKRRVEALRERIKAGQGGKKSLDLLDLIDRDIDASADFTAKQFGEHMEKTVERAKTEVNAYAQHVITRLGLRALKDAGGGPIELEAGETGRDAG